MHNSIIVSPPLFFLIAKEMCVQCRIKKYIIKKKTSKALINPTLLFANTVVQNFLFFFLLSRYLYAYTYVSII